MQTRQQRIDTALQTLIPALRKALASAELWLGLSWDYDDNIVYVGDECQLRIFWHDPTDQYIFQYEAQDRWNCMVNGTENFIPDVVKAIESLRRGDRTKSRSSRSF